MVWPAVIAAGAALAGSALAHSRQKEASRNAWEREKNYADLNWMRQENLYKNRYQYTTEDMKKAGLNPILAASGGFQVGSQPTPSMPSHPMIANNEPQFGSTARDFAVAELSQQQTETEKQKIKNLKEQAKETIAKTYVERAKKGLITQQERESVQRIMKMHSEMERMQNEILLMKERGELAAKEKQKIEKQIQVVNLEMNKLKQSSNVYKTAFGQWMNYLKAFTEAIGVNLGGVVSYGKFK
jgi:hypothetical protein